MIIKVRKDGKEENMYHILVCDDEKDIVSALKIYLTADGYEVFCAYNGKEALEVLESGADGYYDAADGWNYSNDEDPGDIQCSGHTAYGKR